MISHVSVVLYYTFHFQCMALAGSNPVGGGSFVLKACDTVGPEGRFAFVGDQLQLPGLGNYCVTASDSLSVQDCDEDPSELFIKDDIGMCLLSLVHRSIEMFLS
jgi:hypothetical protein